MRGSLHWRQVGLLLMQRRAPGPQMRGDSLKGNVAYFQKNWNLLTNWALVFAIENLWDWNIAPVSVTPA